MGGGKAGRKGIVRISTTTMMMMKMVFCSDFVASYRTMRKNRNQTRCFRHHHHHFTYLAQSRFVGEEVYYSGIHIPFYSPCSRRLTGWLVSNDPAVCRKFIYLPEG